MKRLWLLAVLVCAGCEADHNEVTPIEGGYQIQIKGSVSSLNYYSVVVDGCDYLFDHRGGLAHKGNCGACRRFLREVR